MNLRRPAGILLVLLLTASLFTGCRRQTRVEHGDRHQILHVGNGTEIQDLDPHIVTGMPEHRVIMALLEGLVAEDPVDLHPVPGVAERWDVSPDQLTYTFHLRKNARWSNGAPVTARDFVQSYRRMLAPSLAAEYAYMLYVVQNAEEFNTGRLADFGAVGFKALDDATLQIRLKGPTPYFLSLLCHSSWYPVHLPTIGKYGSVYERGNRWTLPKHFVGNGPFTLDKWRINQVITVKKNPLYWDAANVRLNEIHFYAIESEDTEERAFRSGQLHLTLTIPASKIDPYRKNQPEKLRVDTNFATYFYRFNTTRPPLDNPKVRQALAMSIDRRAIVETILRAGQIPALNLTPPGAAGYVCRTRIEPDAEKARRLLAEAGFPGGRGFPPVEIMFNTSESHRNVAEAIQQMWKKNLNVEARLANQEWKVYIDSQRQMNYQIARYGWNGDYVDPNTFLDMMVTGGANNGTGWGNARYDRLIREAGMTADAAKRLELFQQAEAILMDEMPVMPLYFYTRNYLIQPSVRNWHPTLLDLHPWKHVFLEDAP